MGEPNPSHAYALRRTACGCATEVVIDLSVPAAAFFNDLGAPLLQGRHVDRLTLAEARALPWDCAVCRTEGA